MEQIDRDVMRTHPDMHFFSGSDGAAVTHREVLLPPSPPSYHHKLHTHIPYSTTTIAFVISCLRCTPMSFSETHYILYGGLICLVLHMIGTSRMLYPKLGSAHGMLISWRNSWHEDMILTACGNELSNQIYYPKPCFFLEGEGGAPKFLRI